MDSNQINWLKYWRNSLADSDRKAININTNPVKVSDSYYIEQVPKKHASFIWSVAKPSNQAKTISVDICPVKIVEKFSHGKQNKNKAIEIFPFWIPATMNKEGVLYPPKERKNKPFFVRDYLSPNPSNLTCVSSIKTVDETLKTFAFKEEEWIDYWNKSELFFRKITNKNFEEFNDSEENELYVQVGELRNLTTNILNLYDHLISIKPSLNLFNNISKVEPIPSETYPSQLEVNLNYNHVGQMNGSFPLSKSQRETFSAFSTMKQGDVLAVNGPPGTGKTTVLQSFVANLIVKSVLENRPPYLIMASSTNNQAITNILDSFENKTDEIFTNRWLPDIKSFGLYFSSSEHYKYQTLTNSSSKYDNGFFKDYESKDIESLKSFFFEKFNSTLQEVSSIKEAKEILLSNLKSIDFKSYLDITFEFEKNELILKQLNCNSLEDLDALIENKTIEKNSIQITQNKLIDAEEKVQNVLNNLSFFDKILFFLPSVKSKKKLKFERAVLGIKIPFEITHKEQALFNHIDKLLIEKHKEIESLQEVITTYENKKKIIQNNIKKYNELIEKWDNKFNDKLQELYKKTGSEYQNISCIEDINVRLDISIRNYAFWLCIHYREAEYIELLVQKNERNDEYEKGEKSYKEKLERIACITPLFISTFHSLPKFSSYYKDQELPYFELYDYLIVDEAGQVSPDVALASFSLAKKSIVVGDTLQIEPVWSSSKEIDIHNLLLNNLITENELNEKLNSSGLLCSNGNIMKVSQNSCKYEDNGLKGTMLKEHRRCLNQIIDYSNEYVYDNKLIPKVGLEHNKKHKYPPMGFLNIQSESSKLGTSRVNIKEALIIAKWINENANNLINAYDKDISKIIGVVTPYASQAGEIKKQLKKINKDLSKITVGTVHSLQGAEREIVIFSLVVSKNDPLGFLNSQYNMINVAISRAKHSFLIFGNVELLNYKSNTPLGNLKKWLLKSPRPELSNNLVYAKKGCFDDSIRRVNTLEEHREVLIKAIEHTEKNIYIFSPFISSLAIEADNLCELIKRNIENGIKIFIITDSKLDNYKGTLKPNSKTGREMLINSGAELLITDGIHNKTIIIDDNVLIEGSFNWLSAVRDSSSPYHRHETSIILKGEDIKEKISQAMEKVKYIKSKHSVK